jgi:hypothetical protein
MLALSDAGLAYLAIGASRIPRSRRRKWLADRARQFELGESARPPRAFGSSIVRTRRAHRTASPGARYTRAWRRREKSGRILLRIEIDEAALAAMLVGHKLLDPLLADDRRSLTTATERALAALCEGEVSPHDREIVDTLRARLCLTAFQRTTDGAARVSKPFARRTRAKNTG